MKSAFRRGELTTLEHAETADPAEWIYTVPISGNSGYPWAPEYDYYLVRGYAIVMACGIGTYGSEGFELCGTHLERDSHKAVVEWLTGNRVAYVDKTNNIAIKADWCNGKVAMTGTSYGGTLPFSVATTGVKGLETIIPFAGIACWYDYTNRQGVPITLEVNYADSLAAFNCGGTFLDRDWTVPNREYGSWLWQYSKDQFATNGDYGPIWEESDYAKDWEGLKCPALVVQGLNDFNVETVHADKMVQAFSKAGQNVKLVLHQNGHQSLENYMVNGELWQTIMNRWLAHYLYDIDNGAEDMPAVLVQSNLDGSWSACDSWRDFNYIEAPVYMIKNRLYATLPVRVIDEFDQGGEAGYQDILEYVQDYTYGRAISYGYTDLADPGKGYDISEYTGAADRKPGAFYDYTFYMDPTVYTVRPGHHLVLYLTTWDLYKAYLDRDFVSYDLKKDALDDLIDYEFTVDNEAIRVMMPVKS